MNTRKLILAALGFTVLAGGLSSANAQTPRADMATHARMEHRVAPRVSEGRIIRIHARQRRLVEHRLAHHDRRLVERRAAHTARHLG
jgi:hypothetical protein